MKTRMLIGLALAAAICGLLAVSAAADPDYVLTSSKHFFWAPGQDPQGTVADSTANDLFYHP